MAQNHTTSEIQNLFLSLNLCEWKIPFIITFNSNNIDCLLTMAICFTIFFSSFFILSQEHFFFIVFRETGQGRQRGAERERGGGREIEGEILM